MNFLIDMPVSPRLVTLLRGMGHDAVHAQDIGLSTATDADILQYALRESRVIITADLDFGRLLALAQADGPGVILFRGGNFSEPEMRELLLRVLSSVKAEILSQAIAVVDKKRVRVTRLPFHGGQDFRKGDI